MYRHVSFFTLQSKGRLLCGCGSSPGELYAYVISRFQLHLRIRNFPCRNCKFFGGVLVWTIGALEVKRFYTFGVLLFARQLRPSLRCTEDAGPALQLLFHLFRGPSRVATRPDCVARQTHEPMSLTRSTVRPFFHLGVPRLLCALHKCVTDTRTSLRLYVKKHLHFHFSFGRSTNVLV